MSVENAKLVMDTLAGKTLTIPQAARIATLYLKAFPAVQNPWDPEDNPDEYAAWPTNDEFGQMFLDRVRNEIRKAVVVAARDEYQANVESQAQAEAEEL